MIDQEQLHGRVNSPAPASYVANVKPDAVSTNEQSTYALHFGTRKVALRWVGEIYGQRTEAVKQSAGGKK